MIVSLKQIFPLRSFRKKRWLQLLSCLMMKEKVPTKEVVKPIEDIVHFVLSQQSPVCIDCQEQMNSHIALYQHCRVKHLKSLLNVQCCGAEYYTLAAFAAHCESEHSGQCICIRCRQFFESQAALKNHLLEHGIRNADLVFFCIICGTLDTSKEAIANHVASSHQVETEEVLQFICRMHQSFLEVTAIASQPHETVGSPFKSVFTSSLAEYLRCTELKDTWQVPSNLLTTRQPKTVSFEVGVLDLDKSSSLL